MGEHRPYGDEWELGRLERCVEALNNIGARIERIEESHDRNRGRETLIFDRLRGVEKTLSRLADIMNASGGRLGKLLIWAENHDEGDN